ncbi:hypothetical protein Golomagni_03421 [Golovinomyces magnicellulatus]|nr:hypothetical protein Golomagni_03421 [Golovinomyces magnicellulatus]
MGKITVHCMRHAESQHNLSESGRQIRDPLLTLNGMEQCEQFCRRNKEKYGTITHLVASPLRRTLQTCLMCFEPIIVRKKKEEIVEYRRKDVQNDNRRKRGSGGKRIIALPELQETSSLPSGTGFSRETLEVDFSPTQVDFRFLVDDWYSKRGRWSGDEEAIKARAKWTRRWIRSLALGYVAAMTAPIPTAHSSAPSVHDTHASGSGSGDANEVGCDVEIVVVSHGTFLHFLTEDWKYQRRQYLRDWGIAEIRSFEFESLNNEDATLVETKDSIQSRLHQEQITFQMLESQKSGQHPEEEELDSQQ